MPENKLYYGDNLDVLRRYVKDESVDLVYLDPPFNSRQDYNVLFKEKDGTASASQITAFEDTWEWNLESKAAYEGLVERGDRVSDVMRAFYTFGPPARLVGGHRQTAKLLWQISGDGLFDILRGILNSTVWGADSAAFLRLLVSRHRCEGWRSSMSLNVGSAFCTLGPRFRRMHVLCQLWRAL